jgi:hypothetical protein
VLHLTLLAGCFVTRGPDGKLTGSELPENVTPAGWIIFSLISLACVLGAAYLTARSGN